MGFENIPEEMRLYKQWVCWRYENVNTEKPTKIPYNALTGTRASVTESATWTDFYTALKAVKNYSGIGFVLTELDPFAFIDLDDAHGNQETIEKQKELYNRFNSYAELSPSGRGLHIIVKGKIEHGRRRNSIEIYSSERYMTMTGDVYRNVPIFDYNDELNVLYEEFGKNKAAAKYYGFEMPTQTDSAIIASASSAINAEKFNDLFYGNWQKYYQSQSEADFALIDIIAFYSTNREQIARIFLNSELGKREKAQKRPDYLAYMLNRCFDRKIPPIDTDFLRIRFEDALEKKRKEKEKKEEAVSINIVESVDKNDIYSIPEGLLGDIAKFIFEQAPRPVPEIALAGAIGLMAGICGRAFNVSATGLNQYVLLLSPTGTGKEAMAKGIDKLMNGIKHIVPQCNDFIGPAEIASSQAINKYMARGQTSFVSVVGEFGIYLQQMCGTNAQSHLVGLRRFMLDAFNKSGEGNVLRPAIYSDKSNNIPDVLAPSFSILGESTPEKFYQGLHDGLIAEGLLPRFTLIEYSGDRPPLNEKHFKAFPSPELLEKLSTLCAHSKMLNSQDKAVHLKFTEDAGNLINEYDKHCDAQINSTKHDIPRQLWTRAHMKVLKLSGLVAVGCNPYDPIITKQQVMWAIRIINNDVKTLLDKFATGEIGSNNSEIQQNSEIVRIFYEYFTTSYENLGSLKKDTSKVLHQAKVMPYSFLHKRLVLLACFKSDKIGATNALKRAINTLKEKGDIVQLSPSEAMEKYNTRAQCYMPNNPKTFM